ncbi:unnamed protein product [Echinostoma caproni]|uniref:ABC transporter domain-containing protein n=1 Tax=Echinostoma caproni TaxID=27848 RepID=A0A183AMF8_9TREM|nr:unnamed protein product [Echinostoma caproni]
MHLFTFSAGTAYKGRSVRQVPEGIPGQCPASLIKSLTSSIVSHLFLWYINVSVGYALLQILENFSLKVKPGQTIAFVGPSGSGKSTVVHMLQRFYDPADGQILIDGREIRDLDLKWFRSQLGVVQQEPVLFSGTIAENIAMGFLKASRQQIEEAAKLANAHEFIVGLPNGYDTWIVEGGGSMSGGQKQRIAIARALVRNPKIMLLDEATSALDIRSERQVQAALDQACSGRTVIMIAHRLSTVRDADCILVIERGRVLESGTHEELLEAGGLYATMWRSQVNNYALQLRIRLITHFN